MPTAGVMTFEELNGISLLNSISVEYDSIENKECRIAKNTPKFKFLWHGAKFFSFFCPLKNQANPLYKSGSRTTKNALDLDQKMHPLKLWIHISRLKWKKRREYTRIIYKLKVYQKRRLLRRASIRSYGFSTVDFPMI